MALTKCRECGAQVSDAAKQCPMCGIPNPGQPQWAGCGALVLLAFIGIAFVSCLGAGTNRTAEQYGGVSSAPSTRQIDSVSADVDRLILGSGRDWNSASPTLRTAVTREMAARFAARRGWSNEQQINNAAFLLGCLNSTTEGGGVTDEMQVSELAATCIVMQDAGVH